MSGRKAANILGLRSDENRAAFLKYNQVRSQLPTPNTGATRCSGGLAGRVATASLAGTHAPIRLRQVLLLGVFSAKDPLSQS